MSERGEGSINEKGGWQNKVIDLLAGSGELVSK